MYCKYIQTYIMCVCMGICIFILCACGACNVYVFAIFKYFLLNEGHIRASHPISTASRTTNMKCGIIIQIFAYDVCVSVSLCMHVSNCVFECVCVCACLCACVAMELKGNLENARHVFIYLAQDKCFPHTHTYTNANIRTHHVGPTCGLNIDVKGKAQFCGFFGSFCLWVFRFCGLQLCSLWQ